MRILFVYTTPPYPPDAGGRIVDYNLLKGLAAQGHELTAIALADRRRPAKELQTIKSALDAFCDFRPVLVSLAFKPFQQGLAFLRGIPATMAKYQSDALRAELQRVLKAQRFDALVLNMLHMAYLLEVAQGRVPTILLRHNVQSVIAERLVKIERNPLLRLALWREWRCLRRYEAEMCERVDLCCTLSSVDSATLREMNSALRPEVLPPPLDIGCYRPMQPEEAPPVITFIGGYDWMPNADAAMWLCETIFPRVAKHIPDAELQLIGHRPNADLRRVAATVPSINLVGHVEVLEPYLARTAVFVAPLRAGSGIRIKILEAMAYALPVVSTRIGCEGIGAESPREILIADSEVAFADAVVTLLRDPSARRRIGREGRACVASNHQLPTVIERFESLLSLAAKRRVRLEHCRPESQTKEELAPASMDSQ